MEQGGPAASSENLRRQFIYEVANTKFGCGVERIYKNDDEMTGDNSTNDGREYSICDDDVARERSRSPVTTSTSNEKARRRGEQSRPPLPVTSA